MNANQFGTEDCNSLKR